MDVEEKPSENFDPSSFISYRFPNKIDPESVAQFTLQQIIKFCRGVKFSTKEVKVLDYGCGPTPVYDIAFSSIASKIVLAEYEKSNRDYVMSWLNSSPGCYNWSFYFQYVAELESSECQPKLLENELQQKINGVVPCDITQDRFVAEGYEGPYHILFSSLCIESACKNSEEYTDAIKKLVSLIETDGYFLLMSTIREKSDIGYYTVGNVRLYDLAVKRNNVLKSAKECGLQYIREENFHCVIPLSNLEHFTFFIFQKEVV